MSDSEREWREIIDEGRRQNEINELFARESPLPVSLDGGDTPDTGEHTAGNTGNRSARARGWAFTYNNYTEEAVTHLAHHFRVVDDARYVFQEELSSTGTPHLQGYVLFPNARTLGGLKRIDGKIHWAINIDKLASIEYCSRPAKRAVDGRIWCFGLVLPVRPKDPMENKIWRRWQVEIIQRLWAPPDERRIYWYWSDRGGEGKTTLAKHIMMHFNAAYVGGKAADAKYAVMKMDPKPEVIIFNITRSHEEYVSYEGIESIKDGIFFSPKYESGSCIYPIPHVLVFANFPPRQSALSSGRWEGAITQIDDGAFNMIPYADFNPLERRLLHT